MAIKGKSPSVVKSVINESDVVLPADLYLIEKSPSVSDYQRGILAGYKKGYVDGYNYGFKNPKASLVEIGISEKEKLPSETTKAEVIQQKEETKFGIGKIAIIGISVLALLFIIMRRKR